jgi:hypothetical protein
MSSVKLTADSGGGTVEIKAPATTTSNGAKTLTFSPDGLIGPVLEQFYTPCDGIAIPVSTGDCIIQNVTTVQNGTSTYADLTGSSLSYVPPSGTTTVIYKFDFQLSGDGDSNPIGHFKFFMDSVEVLYARMTDSSFHDSNHVTFAYPIPIGGTANTNTGRVATWTSAKALKMQYREYGSSDQSKVHNTRYWDGATAAHFVIPRIGITALGVPS